MKEFQYTIKDEQGIHARPAGLLVKEASRFESDITLICNEKSGDAKRIFAVMALGVKCGNIITIRAEGIDEESAINALTEFLSANL